MCDLFFMHSLPVTAVQKLSKLVCILLSYSRTFD